MEILVETGLFRKEILEDAMSLAYLEYSVTMPKDIFDTLFPNGIDERLVTTRALYSAYLEYGATFVYMAVAAAKE